MRMRLIQRLRKPLAEHKKAKTWAHAFGGGLEHGGVSVADVRKLSQVFQPEYMGAAEYEFGDLAASYGRFKADLEQLVFGATKFGGVKVHVLCRNTDWEAARDALTRLSAGWQAMCTAYLAKRKVWDLNPPRDNPRFSERLGNPCGSMETAFGVVPLPEAWWDIEHEVFFTVDESILQGFIKTLQPTKGKRNERVKSTQVEKPARRRSRQPRVAV